MGARESIDAVFTWVDGDDLPELTAWTDRLAGELEPDSHGPHRWRDNGELRYALRSIAMYAPWIERVFLVTNGQVPSWLDLDAPGLEVVNHRTIFPDPAVLPTFNSAAIEAVLHRIPGLSTHYLYFNDDVLLGRRVQQEDFLNEDGGTVIYLEGWPAPFRLHGDDLVDRQLARNILYLAPRPVPMVAHTPQLYERDRVREIWERWPHLFATTVGHRFRSERDALLRLFYFSELVLEGSPHEVVTPGYDVARLVRIGPAEDVATTLHRLGEIEPLSICLNDEVTDLKTDGWRWDITRMFLEQRYPTPSPFERTASFPPKTRHAHQ